MASSTTNPRPMVPGCPERSRPLHDTLGVVTEQVARTVGPELTALLLVGGYARGEGGLVARGASFAPYNDLDLVAVVRGRARPWRPKLAELGHTASERAGVDVDLWPVSAAALKRPPRTLFWLDVALGGVRVLWGDEAVLADASFGCRAVPFEEATRLLANRAVGLALSNLEPDPADATRPVRHVHKAVLACGDALLLASDRYRATVRDRARELARLAALEPRHAELSLAYREAARFRLRPDLWRSPASPEAWYRARLGDIAAWHLDFEHWRSGAPREPLAYAGLAERIYSRLPDVAAGGHLAAAARAFARGAAPFGLMHPRERLARVAILLAYAHGEPLADARARRLLGLAPSAPDEEVRGALLRLSAIGG